ncbi:MAG: NAD(P)/FAD-dependent oxidoreductase, partial [Calditrichaeota bacterium]
KTLIPLEPVYRRSHVRFVHGAAREIYPDDQFVVVESADGSGTKRVDYDYLVIATGPYLNFDATPGLGPEKGYTHSLCSLPHAIKARDAYLEQVARMEKGERVKIVVGTGHPGATCQGAAVEYISNIHKDLVRRGLRDKADLLYLSNERTLGDFGIHGVHARYKGRVISGEEFMQAVFTEFGIRWEVQKGVKQVEPGRIIWEDYEGNEGETPFDFAMLVPQFLGHKFKYVGKNGEDVSEKVIMPNGLIKVDAIYGLPYEQLEKNPDAWPSVYQNPNYPNIFAAGIAFAPPGPISIPHTNPNGMKIAAAPPRTGMVSGIIGRIVALNVIDLVKKGRMTHDERMSEMFAACIASMGDSLWDGEAAVIVVYPVVPDFRRYPNEHGRDLFV